MVRRFKGRARGWLGARPRRARVAALTAVATLAAAGGAFAVLRPDGASRQGWQDQVAGPAAGGASAPGQPGAGAGAADGGAASDRATATTGAAAGPGPAGPAPAGAGGTAGSTTTAGGRGPAPTAGQGPATTAPAGAGAAAKPARATEAAGWHLLPAAPIGGRVDQAAVWTGREMVIWGGMSSLDADPLTDGAAFDPTARTWRKIPPAPLTPRFDTTALWTGREVLVFGGTSLDGDILADGAAYDPASNRWRPFAASPLGARDGAVVAWAGDRLVVWGGATVLPPDPLPDAVSEMRTDGSAYVPATDSWVPVPDAPIAARSGSESVWTGSRLVITGGYHEGDDDDRTDGAALDPVTGTWSAIAARPAPGSCGGDSPCDGLWTGTTALFPASGLAYDPAADRWSAVAPYPGSDDPLAGEPAVWTGKRLLAWGQPSVSTDDSDDSADSDDTATNPPPSGGMYDPAANRWQTVPAGPLRGRVLHTAVWTGQEMLVWGGTADDAGLADGAAYRPAE